MRLLRDSCVGGFAPKPPGFCRLSRQNRLCCFAIGGCAPKPCKHFAGGRRGHRLPTIPAAESALRLRPRSALSSAQVLPEWTTPTPPCNDFSSDGDYPLNFVSHSRGSLQLAGSSLIDCYPYRWGRKYSQR